METEYGKTLQEQVRVLSARVSELEAVLARIDKLMIRERQSVKSYVKEVRRAIHSTHARRLKGTV